MTDPCRTVGAPGVQASRERLVRVVDPVAEQGEGLSEKVFKVARLNASLGSNEVGAEHILLGLAAEHTLLEYGVTTERLGEEVRRVLADEARAGD